MKPSRGYIARRIIITYTSLALVVVVVSASSIGSGYYIRKTVIPNERQRSEIALLGARIRSETLLLTNSIQRTIVAKGDQTAERQAINEQIILLEELLDQAVARVNPEDVDESIAIGLIRQYLVAFNVQSRKVLNTSDAEGGLGEETARQMSILLNHYQPALIDALESFEKFERDAAERSIVQAENYVAQTAILLSIIAVTATILTAAMSFWLVKRFIAPLTTLTENVMLPPATFMTTPIHIATSDEMGTLAQALNRMKTEAKESRDKLEQYTATLEHQVEERTRELKLLAITDPLTGVYNRGHFFSLADRLFIEAKRIQHPFSVAIFDIDHFKSVNDTYGHATGDLALKQTAQIMKSQIRQMDVIGRYGGEEFVVALPTAGADEALQIGQRIIAAVRESYFKHYGDSFRLTISGGIASYIYENESLEIVLMKADKALYMAKAQGRNKVVSHNLKT